MASLASLVTIQQFYIAYYQRPGDPSGLLYWADLLDANGGDFNEIDDAFGNSAESTGLYGVIGVDVTIGEFIDNVYQGLFDRDADAAGKAFYTAGYLDGTFTAASLAYDILIGAQNDDAVAIQNKTIVANRFSEIVDGRPMSDPTFGEGTTFNATYSGDDDAADARAMLDGVSSDPTTILSVGELTDFIKDEIANPGDPIYDTNISDVLTPDADFIDKTLSGGADTITGVQAGVFSSTFTNGDVILGNGQTILQLFANSGGPFSTPPVTTLSNLAMVDVVSVASSTLQAVGWTNVANINVNSGANGNAIFATNLDRGTELTISNVTGSLSASFDTPGHNSFGWLRNNDPGSDNEAKLLFDPSNNLTMTLGDLQSGSMDFWDGSVTLGNVNIIAGDETWSAVEIDASGAGDDATVGGVDVMMGDSSTFSFSVDADNDITVGDITVAGGDSASVSISITAGDDASLGDMSVAVGASSDVYVSVSASGSVDMSDVNVLAGDSSSISMYVWGSEDVFVGDVSLAAGDSSSVTASISGSGDVTVGDVSLLAGTSSTVSLSVEAFDGDNVSVGDVNEEAGGDSYAFVGIFNTDSGDVGTTTVGDISVGVGDGSTITVSVSAFASYSGDVGDLTVGDVSAVAGDSSTIDMSFDMYASTGDVGDLTVGDVSAAAGDASNVWVDFESTATSGEAGAMTVGDVDVAVGNGSTTDYVSLDIDVNHYAEDGVGSLTVGDVTMTAGDYASVSFDVEQTITSDGDVGAVTVGNLSVHAGEAAIIDVEVTSDLSGSGTLGDLTVGNINVGAAQDSFVSISISQSQSSGDLGNLTVGDITMLNGDNNHVELFLTSYASSGNAGVMTVGDIDIAVSATTTVDLFGFSTISATIEHNAWGPSNELLGALTIGDVSLAAGDDSHIEFTVYQSGSALFVDDLTIGTVSIEVGDPSSATAYFYYGNYLDNGDLGDFTLGGLDVTLGVDSTFFGSISVYKSSDGDLGNVSIGGMSFDLADSATATVSIDVYVSDGDMGNLALGDLTAVLGASASLSMESISVTVYGDIGDVSVGNMDLTLGESADLYWTPYIYASRDIGDVTVGDITAVLADDAYFDISLSVTADSGDIGDIAIGNLDVTLGEDASGTVSFSFSASRDIGTATIGNLSLVGGVDSHFDFSVSLSASDDVGGMTVGDLAIDLDAGAHAHITYSISASGDAGFMTAGDLDLSASDGSVTATSAGVYGAADIGKHNNGAWIDIEYTLSGTDSGDLTLGDITVDLDTLSDVTISISQANSGDVILGDLTVSGAVGTVTYTGGAAAETGTFDLIVTTAGTITIGNVDYSGYTDDATIDVSWTDLGAGSILGSDNDDTITGNVDDNTINGGGGVDSLTGFGGDDTFVALEGESGGPDAADTPDTVTDWSGDDSTATANDSLSFGLVAGSATNYIEGGPAADLTAFLNDAADFLDSTIKYYVAAVGADLYVAANMGSGEADTVIILTGTTTAEITYADITA